MTDEPGRGRPAPTDGRALPIPWVAAWAATSLAFLLLLATEAFGPRGTLVVDDYGSALAPLASGAACLVAARRATGRWRRGWLLIGLSVVSWAAGGLTWTVYEVHLGTEVPFPSLADVGYLAAAPLAAAALLRMSARDDSTRLRSLLDGSIAASSILVVSWGLVLGPTYHSTEGSALTRTIAVAYPAADVVLAAIALLAVSRARGAHRCALSLIGAAQLLVTFSDSAFLWLTAHGRYFSGNLIDAGWFAGYLLIGLAALLPPGEDDEEEDPEVGGVEIALPYAPLAVGLPFAVWWEVSGRPLDGELFLGGMTVVTLVVVRQMLALVTNIRLGRQLSATVVALRQRERELQHQAFHDPLTGLANRALFTDRVAHSLARDRTSRPATVLLADLDDFKLVNDTLGHQTGDALLVAVAERLRASVRPGDTVARLGGDEFAVLLEDAESVRAAADLAERIARALENPFVLAGSEVVARASIGLATADRVLDGEALLRNADLAMYEAKRQGKGRWSVYEPGAAAANIHHLQLRTELTSALDRDQLRLHYQPIVAVSSGRVTGFEALLRWTHPEHGPVPPDVFVPIAEENGAILPIGRWVLQQACTQAGRWQRRWGGPGLQMAVNVSASQLADPELVPAVAAALRSAGLAPEHLTLEITESSLTADHDEAMARLRQVRALGVNIAIDDFGTGYSGISRLRDYPITTLKVDKSFIAALDDETTQATLLLASIRQLGDGLGADLVAEGVETREQLEALRRLGYPSAQGYLFSRPVAPGTVDELLERGELAIADRSDPRATVPRPRMPAPARPLSP